MKGRPGADHAIQVGDGDARIVAGGGEQAAVRRRPVEVPGVTDSAVGGRQDYGRAVDGHAQVAYQAGVEDRVQIGPIGPAAFPEAVQPGAVGRGKREVGAHNALPYKVSGLTRIATLREKRKTTGHVT